MSINYTTTLQMCPSIAIAIFENISCLKYSLHRCNIRTSDYVCYKFFTKGFTYISLVVFCFTDDKDKRIWDSPRKSTNMRCLIVKHLPPNILTNYKSGASPRHQLMKTRNALKTTNKGVDLWYTGWSFNDLRIMNHWICTTWVIRKLTFPNPPFKLRDFCIHNL